MPLYVYIHASCTWLILLLVLIPLNGASFQKLCFPLDQVVICTFRSTMFPKHGHFSIIVYLLVPKRSMSWMFKSLVCKQGEKRPSRKERLEDVHRVLEPTQCRNTIHVWWRGSSVGNFEAGVWWGWWPHIWVTLLAQYRCPSWCRRRRVFTWVAGLSVVFRPQAVWGGQSC